MRSLVLQMGVSVDGFVASSDGTQKWAFRGGEPEGVTAWKLASLANAGTHVVGRVTYEEMAAHWPTATGGYAEVMNDLPKVVFSQSLESAEWPESRIARGGLAEEIAALKAEPGGEIFAHGGATFVQALTAQGLVDEYRLVIRPVALGAGRSLFGTQSTPLHLDLVEAHSYPGGVAIHVYRPLKEL